MEIKNVKCSVCPRKCSADRRFETGFCGMYDKPEVALYMLHRWEEPFISGAPDDSEAQACYSEADRDKNTPAARKRRVTAGEAYIGVRDRTGNLPFRGDYAPLARPAGSGAVFFKGCSLKCVYCQNHKIAFYHRGDRNDSNTNSEKLTDIFLKLQAGGACNINLVTPTHFTLEIIEAVREAKEAGLSIPVVWNTSGYELPETIALLNDTVDVYLTDLKYYKEEPALRYSGAPNYFETAAAALEVMVRQKPRLVFDEKSMLKSGVAVRHMTLPGLLSDSCRILEYLYRKYGDNIFISIMSQYTPQKTCDFDKYPELKNKVPRRQYAQLVKFAKGLGITNAYVQGGEAVSESFTPDF